MAPELRTGPPPLNESIEVSILTGGCDTPYAIPLIEALSKLPLQLEVVGSDQILEARDFTQPHVAFLNLHGNMGPNKPLLKKIARVVASYVRLFRYAARTDSQVFHILWHNTFDLFDRTILTLYYKALGKRLVLTAHNIDIDERDARRRFGARWSLGLMYRMLDHIFVHTEKMKSQLEREFDLDGGKITVIPFGMNTVATRSDLTPREARRRLGLGESEKVVLFFGHIAPYKGLEYLIQALGILKRKGSPALKLVIAGRVKERQCEVYWAGILRLIEEQDVADWVRSEIRYIPDEEIEVFFKAADVCALPYVRVYQTGVLILSYGYGLPAVASDAGSLREDVIEGETGFVCRHSDPAEFARLLEMYFDSELYTHLDRTRENIARIAEQRHAWSSIAVTTASVYRDTYATLREPRCLSWFRF